jgi:hypothetical protein
MSKFYKTEKEGQTTFFETSLLDKEVSFQDHTDGVIKGTLFEFKLLIDNINSVLFQAIKYLSRMRIKGENVPAHILLIDLNRECAFYFNSVDFLSDIQKTYIGAASKNNNTFNTPIKPKEINTSNRAGRQEIYDIVDDEKYTKITIDENCVIGWAERFYSENPKATKSDMFDELRNPKCFKNFIHKWKGIESDFKFIMDCLNDKMHRKELGAFYTPKEYCKISAEMVRKAIKEIPKGNDYVILDRCAGTGNLEQFFTDEELSHCIVATYELKEWQVLNYRLGDKVRFIIPPIKDDLGRPILEREDFFSHNNPNAKGLLHGGDALSVEVFPELKEYVDNPKCNIIMIENPPYNDTSADNIGDTQRKSTKENYIFENMKNDLKNLSNSNVSTAREISNQFIWSAWKYYLKKLDDQFILYSPIKYWKSLGLGNKEFKEGYLFNRYHFHASTSSIACIRWRNKSENKEILSLKPIDIIFAGNSERIIDYQNIEIKKAHRTFESLYDRRTFHDDEKTNVHCESNGYEAVERKLDGNAIYNKNIIGYLCPLAYQIHQNNIHLLRAMRFNARGFYLRSDNYIKKLPLFCAKLYPQEEWVERDIYFTTADRGENYANDPVFLKSCLIFACLSQRNKCLSFNGSDGKFYKNELCFDKNTQASKDLENMALNKMDNEILNLWEEVLNQAKKTEEYNKSYTYGLWQIENELNIWIDDDSETWTNEAKEVEKQKRREKKKKELVLHRKYVNLNTAISALKTALKDYYKTQIQDKLFKYELLK